MAKIGAIIIAGGVREGEIKEDAGRWAWESIKTKVQGVTQGTRRGEEKNRSEMSE